MKASLDVVIRFTEEKTAEIIAGPAAYNGLLGPPRNRRWRALRQYRRMMIALTRCYQGHRAFERSRAMLRNPHFKPASTQPIVHRIGTAGLAESVPCVKV